MQSNANIPNRRQAIFGASILILLTGCNDKMESDKLTIVIENVEFKANKGISREQMINAAKLSNTFAAAQKGFIRRTLSVSQDGTWFDYVEWENKEAAEEAAKKFPNSEECKSFIAAIDFASVKMRHFENLL